jgi:glycosyltransferase involved in cell wall biosynthesis
MSERNRILFSTTVIPTVGRASLADAVNSVLSQDAVPDAFEVIVVNDSGEPLPTAPWQQDERVRVMNTVRRERSVARNTGASAAKGRYLHFLDDDDWLAPAAFRYLRRLSQANRAAWLYGTTQLVDREHKPLLQLRHRMTGNCFIQVMAGEWIPLQSSLIDARAFFEAGGFNQLITGPEDIDLLRRIALRGEIAGTEHLVSYIVRGENGSTTDYGAHAERSRWARERILGLNGVLPAALDSAHTPYLRGRILRLYLTSLAWNGRRRRWTTAASRLAFSLASGAMAAGSLFTRDYWRAVAGPYESDTWQRGIQESARRATEATSPELEGRTSASDISGAYQ